jgi:hypothetical protein
MFDQLPTPVEPFGEGYHPVRIGLAHNGTRELRGKDVRVGGDALTATLDTGAEVTWPLSDLGELSVGRRP